VFSKAESENFLYSLIIKLLQEGFWRQRGQESPARDGLPSLSKAGTPMIGTGHDPGKTSSTPGEETTNADSETERTERKAGWCRGSRRKWGS
jgi:hypothetical protein